ncbi:YihY/virulence factor BrkB family protein [Streptomonospora litoralis]|uniref:Uncharacterized protein n=1 Tax=Streptomonospora litoralis TaxID=2498135 RepID=A0A4P6Q5Q4_9ACTN|nr:YihY/virulence factor BrkB family protein [Streptomonospora litoralis]QBI54681.1 ribonuclease BN/unknown domain fusion protein [Streptomonospora litoralis]
MARAAERIAAWQERHPRLNAVAVLTGRTVRAIGRTRVVGLAAESAFFSLLSLPALLLGLVGTLGHLRPVLGADTVLEIRAWLLGLASTALTADTVDSIVAPLVDEFLQGAQGGLLSVTFVVSLWSGSRAMNVFIDAITIAYGLDELRGYLRRRILALLAYLGGLLFALVVLPVLVAGPDLVHRLLPITVGYLHLFYWPLVCVLSALAVAMLYVLSTPVRTPLWRYLPGALVAMLVLLGGSVLLRIYLDASFGQVTIYGSLGAPIAILAWLWLMALAVLIGSALNAEIDAMWPTPRTAAARAEIAALRHARARRMVERREEALQATGRPQEDPGETAAEITARMRRLLGWGAERDPAAQAAEPVGAQQARRLRRFRRERERGRNRADAGGAATAAPSGGRRPSSGESEAVERPAGTGSARHGRQSRQTPEEGAAEPGTGAAAPPPRTGGEDGSDTAPTDRTGATPGSLRHPRGEGRETPPASS